MLLQVGNTRRKQTERAIPSLLDSPEKQLDLPRFLVPIDRGDEARLFSGLRVTVADQTAGRDKPAARRQGREKQRRREGAGRISFPWARSDPEQDLLTR